MPPCPTPVRYRYPDSESRFIRMLACDPVRPARAASIRIAVDATEYQLKLTSRDDGVGFDPDEARQPALKSGSLGLISMEERAQLSGGRIKMRTAKGEGITIKATFALSLAPAENQ